MAPPTQTTMTSLTWDKEQDDAGEDLHAAVELEVYRRAFL